MIFSQIKSLLLIRNIYAKQLSLKTVKRAHYNGQTKMQNNGQIECRIAKEPAFIVAKIKMSISTCQKIQNKYTWIHE